MALKALDKSFETFVVGDVVVNEGYGSPYGVRIVKKVYLEVTDDYRFIAVKGEVLNGKWVDAKSSDGVILAMYTAKQLRTYSHKWTPGETFNPGDVLKDQDGTFYLVASSDNVWNLSRGTKTSQASWEKTGTTFGGRKFTRVKTASGSPFTEAIKVEDVWKNRW